MTNTKRWLDELPLESSERALLLVGKSARPALGAMEADWQALCVALSSTAAGAVGASGVAAKSGSAKVSSSLVMSKAASGGLVAASLKSLALGVTVGLAVMGAGAAVERLSGRDGPPASAAERTRAPIARPMSVAPTPARSAAQVGIVAVAPAASQPGAARGFATQSEPFAASNSLPNQAGAPSAASAASAASPAPDAASLSQQARELAELKRMIDSGAASEALRRLDATFSEDAVPVLSEERDALYVQALDRTHRRQEARRLAQQFLVRHPHSPYVETMRQVLGAE